MSTTATKTDPKPASVGEVLERRKQKAYKFYHECVGALADYEEVDTEALADAMQILGLTEEHLNGDVDVPRQRKAMVVYDVDYSETDAELAQLLEWLTPRAELDEDRTPSSKSYIQPERTAMPLTPEVVAELNEKFTASVTLRNKVMDLLTFEFHKKADGRLGGAIYKNANQIEDSKRNVNNELILARDLEQCNPRVFNADHNDHRAAWSIDEVRLAVNDPSGQLLQLRKNGRDPQVQPKAKMTPVNTPNSSLTGVYPTPYRQ